MSKYTSKNNAYQSCILNAECCEPVEAAGYYRLAIMVDPVAEEGYLGLINCLKDGNGSAEAADVVLKNAFLSAEYDRKISNIENLRINTEGYERVIRAAEGMTGCA